LIVDERTHGRDVEGGGPGGDGGLKSGDGVGEGLPAGSRRRNDDVVTITDRRDRIDLMLVQGVDVLLGESDFDWWADGERSRGRGLAVDMTMVDDLGAIV
jgi:hypothetical protein